MSTRCTINFCYKTEDGEPEVVAKIYRHSDGYPDTEHGVKNCLKRFFKDVEKRIKDFINFLKTNYNHKHVAVIAHKATQLAFEVLIKNKTWQYAINKDWRNTKQWQPGWEYELQW